MKQKLSVVKKKADKAFSEAVRIRDSDQFGFLDCITCGRHLHYKDAHAGHFQSRRYSSTRFDPLNVNGQCPGCNMFGAGEQYKYGKALDLKYGDGTAERLEKKAQEHHKLTIGELEEIIKESKEGL
jgi:hypothetical protein